MRIWLSLRNHFARRRLSWIDSVSHTIVKSVVCSINCVSNNCKGKSWKKNETLKMEKKKVGWMKPSCELYDTHFLGPQQSTVIGSLLKGEASLIFIPPTVVSPTVSFQYFLCGKLWPELRTLQSALLGLLRLALHGIGPSEPSVPLVSSTASKQAWPIFYTFRILVSGIPWR